MSVFTAITFFRLPATWKPKCKRAEKSQESLRVALKNLSQNDAVAQIELECGHKIVAQMRRDMKLEGPKPEQGDSAQRATASGQDATAFGQAATASGQHTTSSGQVATSSAFGSSVHQSIQGAENLAAVASVNQSEEKIDVSEFSDDEPEERARIVGTGIEDADHAAALVAAAGVAAAGKVLSIDVAAAARVDAGEANATARGGNRCRGKAREKATALEEAVPKPKAARAKKAQIEFAPKSAQLEMGSALDDKLPNVHGAL